VRALLDINVIIALLDTFHTFHDRAHVWWAANSIHGWASCPITENGVVRILSHPNYTQRRRFNPAEVISLLQTFAQSTRHQFWADDLSLCDAQVFAANRLLSSQQLADQYLLALAVHHGGRLATFDQSIHCTAVRSSKPANLCVI
jgi:toxin-antitoxin system PIN domain toxin